VSQDELPALVDQWRDKVGVNVWNGQEVRVVPRISAGMAYRCLGSNMEARRLEDPVRAIRDLIAIQERRLRKQAIGEGADPDNVQLTLGKAALHIVRPGT
jgi:hypothetical protein